MTDPMPPPNETPEDFRQRADRIESKFFDDFEKQGGPFRDQGFEYDKLANDYAHKGLQTQTYLNGGALVAIPTAMAFFKADVAKFDILLTACAFVVGLLFVVLAQCCAFFTLAKRSEAQEEYRWAQYYRIAALQLPLQTPLSVAHLATSNERHLKGNKRLRHSNIWRWVALAFFSGSLIAFIVGCGLGAEAILVAKEKSDFQGPRNAD